MRPRRVRRSSSHGRRENVPRWMPLLRWAPSSTDGLRVHALRPIRVRGGGHEDASTSTMSDRPLPSRRRVWSARRALVVDDEDDIRTLIVHHLAEAGFEVNAVATGAEA